MKHITGADVQKALETIRPYVPMTPLVRSFYDTPGRKIYYKLECEQRARSFKIRGAVNKMRSLTPEQRAAGVATVSSGNHGSSVAYAAQMLGIDTALVIVPTGTPQSKIDRIRYFGGEVLILGRDYDEAHAAGMALIAEKGMTYVDAYYEDPLIYAGQGTIALEILSQNPDIDTIVVPIGGGGLSTGIAVGAKSVRPDIRVIGIQTEACPAMVRSIQDHVFYEEFPSAPSRCDALLGGIGKLAYEMAPTLLDDVFTVSEAEIADAVRFMLLEEKRVCEAASATAVAAIRYHADRVGGANIAAVISGANIDGNTLKALLTE